MCVGTLVKHDKFVVFYWDNYINGVVVCIVSTIAEGSEIQRRNFFGGQHFFSA